MARREKQNRASQPKKTRGLIDINKQGMHVVMILQYNYVSSSNGIVVIVVVTVVADDDEEGVLDNLLQCLNTGSVFKQ